MKKQMTVKLITALMPIALVLLVVFMTNSNVSIASSKLIEKQGSQYAQYCSKCHGGDGTSQTAKGKKSGATDLTKSRISDAKGIRIIKNGAGQMPGYKGDLSDAEIQALMSYVKGFRK